MTNRSFRFPGKIGGNIPLQVTFVVASTEQQQQQQQQQKDLITTTDSVVSQGMNNNEVMTLECHNFTGSIFIERITNINNVNIALNNVEGTDENIIDNDNDYHENQQQQQQQQQQRAPITTIRYETTGNPRQPPSTFPEEQHEQNDIDDDDDDDDDEFDTVPLASEPLHNLTTPTTTTTLAKKRTSTKPFPARLASSRLASFIGSVGSTNPSETFGLADEGPLPTLNDTDNNDNDDNIDYVTPLHEACARQVTVRSSTSSSLLQELQFLLQQSPQDAAIPDQHGRLPLHVLSNNPNFTDTTAGTILATKFALCLIQVYPKAVILTDHIGRMPFTVPLEEWTLSIYNTAQQDKNNVNSTMGRHIQAFLGRSMDPAGQSSNNNNTSITNQAMMQDTTHPTTSNNTTISSTSQFPSNESSKAGSNIKKFPPTFTTNHVMWCFKMLSTIMNILGGDKSITVPSGSNKASSSSSSSLSIHPSKNAQLKHREALAKNVASIPWLWKSVILIESYKTRCQLLNSSILRRALFCPQGLGSWFTPMLRHGKSISPLAIDFLMMLSNVTVADYIGEFREPRPVDVESFQAKRQILYESVEEKMSDIIPSIAVLQDTNETERAVSTNLVWFLMTQGLTRPFIGGLIITDFSLHITLMFAFRRNFATLAFEDDTHRVHPENLILAICAYIAFVKLCELVALVQISLKMFIRHALDLWNIAEVAVVFTTFISIIIFKLDHETLNANLNALVMGLLWFRFLSFLKVMNHETATFILAFVEIIRKIRYFLLVFVVVLIMFADSMQTIYRTHSAGLCENQDDLTPIARDFCSERAFDAYLRTYGIVLGDLSIDDYKELPAIITIFLLITFFCFIILLNILIAVVSDAYAKARLRGDLLFRRARIEFIVSHSAIESWLIPPKVSPNNNNDNIIMPNSNNNSIILRMGGFAIFIFMTIVSVYAQIYMIERARFAQVEAQVWIIRIILYFMVTVSSINLLMILLLILQSSCLGENEQEATSSSSLSSIMIGKLNVLTQRIVFAISSYLFGLDSIGNNISQEEDDSSKSPNNNRDKSDNDDNNNEIQLLLMADKMAELEQSLKMTEQKILTKLNETKEQIQSDNQFLASRLVSRVDD